MAGVGGRGRPKEERRSLAMAGFVKSFEGTDRIWSGETRERGYRQEGGPCGVSRGTGRADGAQEMFPLHFPPRHLVYVSRSASVANIFLHVSLLDLPRIRSDRFLRVWTAFIVNFQPLPCLSWTCDSGWGIRFAMTILDNIWWCSGSV